MWYWFQTAIPNQYGPGQMNQYNSQSMYTQQTHPSQQYQSEGIMDAARPPSSTSLRRNSRILSPQDRPGTIGQTLNDRSDVLFLCNQTYKKIKTFDRSFYEIVYKTNQCYLKYFFANFRTFLNSLRLYDYVRKWRLSDYCVVGWNTTRGHLVVTVP